MSRHKSSTAFDHSTHLQYVVDRQIDSYLSKEASLVQQLAEGSWFSNRPNTASGLMQSSLSTKSISSQSGRRRGHLSTLKQKNAPNLTLDEVEIKKLEHFHNMIENISVSPLKRNIGGGKYYYTSIKSPRNKRTGRCSTNKAGSIELPSQQMFRQTFEEFEEIQQDVDSDAPYILKSDRWKQKVNNSKNKKFAEAAEFARWTKSYETEVTSFDSMALFAELRLRDILSMKEHSNGPTKIKTAVLSDLLFFVCSKLGRYGSLITPILAELMKCIYKNFDANAVKAGESVRTFYQLTPFFELCDNLEETAADMEEELRLIDQGVEMKSIVKKLQTVRCAYDTSTLFLRDACFSMWKKYIVSRKGIEAKLERKNLAKLWERWQQYVMLQKGKIVKSKGLNRLFLQELLDKATENATTNLIAKYGIEVTNAPLPSSVDTNIHLPNESILSDDKLQMKSSSIQPETAHSSLSRPLSPSNSHKIPNSIWEMKENDKCLQTPRKWNIPRNIKDGDNNSDYCTSSDEEEPDKPIAKKQFIRLNSDEACTLISAIYEAMCNSLANGSLTIPLEDFNLLDFAKETLLLRYGKKSVAIKHLNGLIMSCQKDSSYHKRMDLFAYLCGISISNIVTRTYDPSRCSFFFELLSHMFPISSSFSEIFNSKTKDIDRHVALKAFSQMFHLVEKKSPEFYILIEKEILKLKSTTLPSGNSSLCTKINIDSFLHLIMHFYEIYHLLQAEFYDQIELIRLQDISMSYLNNSDCILRDSRDFGLEDTCGSLQTGELLLDEEESLSPEVEGLSITVEESNDVELSE